MSVQQIKRREFIAASGGAAAWPVAVRGQQPAMPPVIGYLRAQSPAEFASRLEAFPQGLGESGYVNRRNVTIEFRWTKAAAADGYQRWPSRSRSSSGAGAIIVAPGGARTAGLRGKVGDRGYPNRLRDQ